MAHQIISKIADAYKLSKTDRSLTLAHIIEDPLASISSSKAVEHLINLARVSGVDETHPVIPALQETIPYLEKYERWR